MSITSNNLQVREIINQVVNDPAYRNISSVPLVSVHQIGLIILAYAGVFGGMVIHAYWDVSLWIVYPIMIFAFYSAFTPLHDATHRAVSSNKFLNDFLGTLSGNILFPLVTTDVYRFLHMAHHRYVGDKELDPDEGMVAIPTNYFPLGYLILLIPEFLWVHWLFVKAWKRTPYKTRIAIVLMFAGNLVFHVAWFCSPYWYEYLIFFFIPNRLGILYVAFAFAHTPHPEGLKWNDFPFQTTFKLKANKFFLESLFGQEHHAMHHFLPHIPWYKYHKVWDLANGVFRRQFIPEKKVFSIPDTHYKEEILSNPSLINPSELLVKVASIENVAKDVKTLVLHPFGEGNKLPDFTAGSHINITLPSGRIRSYSLINPTYEKNRYQIAVKLDKNGQGGSREMHEEISVGDSLKISTPRNNFILYENAKKFILISGGIGITPLISMSHRLIELDKFFEFHICAKDIDEIPFRYELNNWTFAPNVEFHLDKNGKSSIDLSRILTSPDEETLIYVCGPAGFNKWVTETAMNIGWGKDRIKQELFSSSYSGQIAPKAFELILNNTKKKINVRADETIIDALHQNNIKVPYTCMQGTCGTCVTPVLEGNIDHRDAVLTEEEKLENNKMCLCVSRAKDDYLVIDL